MRLPPKSTVFLVVEDHCYVFHRPQMCPLSYDVQIKVHGRGSYYPTLTFECITWPQFKQAFLQFHVEKIVQLIKNPPGPFPESITDSCTIRLTPRHSCIYVYIDRYSSRDIWFENDSFFRALSHIFPEVLESI